MSQAAPSSQAPFSALELNDPVVIMALFDQLVTEHDVATLWRVWRWEMLGLHKEPFWRLLTRIPQIDPELIYGEAARVFGFETAHVSAKDVSLLKDFARAVTADRWKQFVSIPVIPIGADRAGRFRFATNDPTHPAVKHVLDQAGVGAYEVFYAPRGDIQKVLDAAFPSRSTETRHRRRRRMAAISPPQDGAA